MTDKADTPKAMHYGFDDLVKTAVRSAKLALAVGLAFSFLAIVVMQIKGVKYTAKMVIAIEQNDDSSISASLGGFSPLLSNILPSEDSEVFGIFFTSFTSERVARSLIKSDSNIVARFVPGQFDDSGEEWQGPGLLKGYLLDPIRRLFGYPRRGRPGSVELAEYLQESIKIITPETPNLREVEFEHEDPAFAQALLEKLYFETNELIKNDRQGRSLKRVNYIERQLEMVQVTDHREMLLSLLMSEQQKLLLLEEGSPLGLVLVQPPFSPPQPSSPLIFVILMVSFIMGFVLTIFFSILFSELRAGAN